VITVIDIQTGNIASVRRALAHLGIAHRIAVSPEELSGAEKIIFPGVGSFS
jgi:imidazoleglycerol phosphate synthase glutamine amidotransferase subunit HisH